MVVSPPLLELPLLNRDTKDNSAADAGFTPSGTPASDVNTPEARLFGMEEVVPPRRESPPVRVVIRF